MFAQLDWFPFFVKWSMLYTMRFAGSCSVCSAWPTCVSVSVRSKHACTRVWVEGRDEARVGGAGREEGASAL